MNKVIFFAFIFSLTSCAGIVDEENSKYEVPFQCNKNNVTEFRKLTSSEKLTEEEIIWYKKSLENKFGYKEGTCIRM